jgi:hypothetical protein
VQYQFLMQTHNLSWLFITPTSTMYFWTALSSSLKQVLAPSIHPSIHPPTRVSSVVNQHYKTKFDNILETQFKYFSLILTIFLLTFFVFIFLIFCRNTNSYLRIKLAKYFYL